jgi:RimJ/RimL family protein N-acetyltransferase
MTTPISSNMLYAEPIDTLRLDLHPLRPADADALFPVLNDERLHGFIGGRPLTLAALRRRYRALASGRSPDGREAWLNWTVRLRADGSPIGTLQASVSGDVAEVAWVVGVAWQGCGYASEAARALVGWLRLKGVIIIRAAIHPEHVASQAVARRAGLAPTAETVDGETVWGDQRTAD